MILKRVPVTIVAEESNKYYKFWVCVCSPSYPECKAHVPYYITFSDLRGSTIFFPRYIINSAIFGRKLLNVKCVFRFSLQVLSAKFLIARRD